MASDQPQNIFQAASQQLGKKKEKPSLSEKKPLPPIKPEETDDAFSRMDEMRRDLEKKLEDIYSQGGLSHEALTQYLDNRANFPGPLFDAVQSQRQKLLDGIWEKLGKKSKETHIKKEEKKMAGTRKKKTLGDRRKWIPMR